MPWRLASSTSSFLDDFQLTNIEMAQLQSSPATSSGTCRLAAMDPYQLLEELKQMYNVVSRRPVLSKHPYLMKLANSSVHVFITQTSFSVVIEFILKSETLNKNCSSRAWKAPANEKINIHVCRRGLYFFYILTFNLVFFWKNNWIEVVEFVEEHLRANSASHFSVQQGIDIEVHITQNLHRVYLQAIHRLTHLCQWSSSSPLCISP